VTATLTFTNPKGEQAKISRNVISPVDSAPIVSVEKDDALIIPPEFIETGLLMPARIGHVGFGSKSQSLYDALKMLTGLDQLASIGLGAAGLCHGAKRFLKYSKVNGIEGLERSFMTCLERAKEQAEDCAVTLPAGLNLGLETLDADLTTLEEDSSKRAASALAVLKTEISQNLDLSNLESRDSLARAVWTARAYLSDGTKSLPLFSAWTALTEAGKSGFLDVQNPVEDARAALVVAVRWHEKQQADEKLRLKALASKFYVVVDLLKEEASCPLCETKLTSENQLLLAAELKRLKESATVAERALSDACRDIIQQLKSYVPDGVAEHSKTLKNMNPREAFAETIKERFSDGEPFRNTLTGMAGFAREYAEKLLTELPSFTLADHAGVSDEIEEVKRVRAFIDEVERLSSLTAWWSNYRGDFVTGWKGLVGVKQEGGEWPSESLEGKLQALEGAMAGSDPLDKIAKQMATARSLATSWNEVNQIQKKREAIAEAVAPLKALVHLVDSETHRTVITLKDRVATILDDIRLKDRLSFVETAMAKKAVTVEGQFADGMQIDAALVANSSWLRALLWSFIFALREQAIADSNENVFPLMVLDDPQTTFDPKNKLKWAQKITSIANLDPSNIGGMQLFLTTHEHEFANLLSLTYQLSGQEGKMAGATKSSNVARVVNGTYLERQFEKASSDEDDEEGYKYVQQVRVYCEGLLKIMLRPESFEISGTTLSPLIDLLRKLNADGIAPYNRSTFVKLANLLDSKTQPIIKTINESHHAFNGTIGYSQAIDVRLYWKTKLERIFIHAFRRAADFDAYGGVSHLFPESENVIEFPVGHTEKIKTLSFTSTGIMAAAESDGLVGSGIIEIEEWEQTKPITLFKHSAYRLNAGTLDPVVGIGDVVLVQDFGEPRDSNLTVVSIDGKLFARRLNQSEEDGDIAVLTAQATDPYALHVPVVVPRSSISPRKIVGTLFMSKAATPPINDGHEVCVIPDFNMIEKHLKNVILFKVKGRSMEPIALNEQFVMTVNMPLSPSSLSSMNGELVIAVDEDAGVYFKRMRLHGDLVVLESVNSSNSTSSEILSLEDGTKYKKLTSIRSVVGVLFDLPSS